MPRRLKKQTIIDKCREHFVKQRGDWFSYDAKADTCNYRGPHGRPCAAGLFLSDANARTADARNYMASRLAALGQLPTVVDVPSNSAFWGTLQSAHDICAGYTHLSLRERKQRFSERLDAL